MKSPIARFFRRWWLRSNPALCVCHVKHDVVATAHTLRWYPDGGICEVCCGATGEWRAQRFLLHRGGKERYVQ